MHKSTIITGEASETDSEDEAISNQRVLSRSMTNSIQGAIISGEDSETEDEHGGSTSSAVSALTHRHKGTDRNKPDEGAKYNSLLHNKLRECNNNLFNDVEQLCHGVIDPAAKNLATIDQQLLHSQLTIQNAVTSLRSLTANSVATRDKLLSILSSNFIANIKANADK